MKIILRILVILGAAMVVVGIAFALNQGGTLESGAPARPERTEFTAASATGGTGREFRQRGGVEGGVSVRGLADVAKSLVVVGLIVALYSLSQFVWQKLRGKHGENSIPPTPQVTDLPS